MAIPSFSTSAPTGAPSRFNTAKAGRDSVLVVDDDAAFVEEMVEHITRVGIRAIACYSAEDAFSAIGRERPSLVFLDVVIPGFDGRHLAQLALGLDYRMAIVLMTGSEDVYHETLKSDLALTDVIKKPFSWRLMDPYLETFIETV